ncbi:hypothetical protein CYLTODRAFT_434414 [Cylindrobasidium torrendii FP15055 ss-10]|uniref:RING-type domain-containing protein n=1 Tax=Cylindrobasidium torrendii FP15055 ss-10 TaxID=1314674 RepID=A0A0D7BS93_9AGAR|nr:hypothetical protein CYLTODRAFT_434414 [Cylindrobasidium torrendii FP15055 ss-10]
MEIPGLWLLSLVLLLPGAFAYIPASPTNDTQLAIDNGLNVTDVSKLHLQWFMNGSYWESISYQLVGAGTTGIAQGALMHFTEDKANNETVGSTTPWVALVSCDANVTDMNPERMEIDIFTLARDKGATGALLYSLYSQACIINPEYADPETFDQVFDIYSTKSLTSAHLIEYQFGQIGSENKTLGGDYDAKKLDNYSQIMNDTINAGYATQPGYLYATLWAYNATGVSNETDSGGNSGGNNGGKKGGSNTALAMIVLYAITGCVSALFCVIIITGAIRAIRHPERYGQRRRGAGGEVYQTRTQGLGRAILDTFPIVKFGSSRPPTSYDPKDPEAPQTDEFGRTGPVMQMQDVRRHLEDPGPEDEDEEVAAVPAARPRPAKGSTEQPAANASAVAGAASGSRNDAPLPEAIGHETCPICIVDFEDDDDVRILPCEGHHRFHQQCVDPWLLELSSSCPICRQDFHALESLLSREDVEDDDEQEEYARARTISEQNARPHSNRFSRYVRSAIRRRRDRGRQDTTDEQVPPMPQVPPPAHDASQ